LTANQPAYANGMEVRYFPERIQAIQNAIMLVKIFIYTSLVVTLLLGGLGITNVMLGAVRERTTEIGLRKAVGATEEMIMKQFILESVTISLMGAAIGMGVGFISVECLKVFARHGSRVQGFRCQSHRRHDFRHSPGSRIRIPSCQKSQ